MTNSVTSLKEFLQALNPKATMTVKSVIKLLESIK